MLSIGPCLGLGPYLPAPTVRLGAAPCSQRTADAPSRRRQAPRASSAAPAAAAAVRGGGPSASAGNICVLGAGVIGLTAALRCASERPCPRRKSPLWQRSLMRCADFRRPPPGCLQSPSYYTHIVLHRIHTSGYSDADWLLQTTSHGAGGLWKPYTLVSPSPSFGGRCCPCPRRRFPFTLVAPRLGPLPTSSAIVRREARRPTWSTGGARTRSTITWPCTSRRRRRRQAPS